MGIKIKKDGVWKDIILPTSKIYLKNFSLPAGAWIWDNTDSYFYQDVQISDVITTHSILTFLDYNQEGIIKQTKPYNGGIRITANQVPSKSIQGTVIYTDGGAYSSFYLVGGITNVEVEEIKQQITQSLPITVAKDGYVDIEKVRRITNIQNKKVKKEDGACEIHITTTYEGVDVDGNNPKTLDIITLDAAGVPNQGNSNGFLWGIEWQDWDIF